MFEFGFWEMLLVLIVAVCVLGPTQLRQLAHGLGRVARYFRHLRQQVSDTLDDQAKQEQLKVNEAKARAADAAEASTQQDATRQEATDQHVP